MLLTALIVGVLVYFESEIREHVTDLSYGTLESRRDASQVVPFVVVFVALVAGATVPFIFDLALLLAGLCVVLSVGCLLLDYAD